MKVTVTALKAGWPPAVKVGDVVELPHAEIPAWALGKCVPSDDGAEAVAKWEPPASAAPAAPAATGKASKA